MKVRYLCGFIGNSIARIRLYKKLVSDLGCVWLLRSIEKKKKLRSSMKMEVEEKIFPVFVFKFLVEESVLGSKRSII